MPEFIISSTVSNPAFKRGNCDNIPTEFLPSGSTARAIESPSFTSIGALYSRSRRQISSPFR